MRLPMFPPLVLIIFSFFSTARATCPCDGIVLTGSDNEQHCWQIESRLESTWSDADETCSTLGGHIGHPGDSVFATVLSYAQNVSSLPVLTGIVSGSDNGDLSALGMMCQDNVLYNKSVNATNMFSNEATNETTCSFISNSSSELVFLECNINANVLCDRPLVVEDYCSIKANCSSTTTFFTTTTAQSTTTSNTSLTSPTGSTTQSNSSLPTGGTSSLSPTTTNVGSTTKASGSGSGGGNSCTCTDGSTTTVAPASSGSGECSQPSGCLKHQWKIIGMCVDWRAMLALIGIGLLLFLCCCICHFCMHACMFCTPAAKRERLFFFIVRDPILHNTSVIAPIPLPLPKKIDYDVEKSDMVILPPAAIQPEPVIITVPEKHESVYGFHTKEIIHVMPDKPSTREIGTMTDAMDFNASILPVGAPAIKRKKVIKKPKKMFIPATSDPMDSIEEDVAAEIPIDIPQSPDARSIAPLGDVADPVPLGPHNFIRNPKPMMPEGKVPQNEFPVGQRRGESSPAGGKPNNRDNDEFDPRGLRSPPPPAGQNNDAAPRRMTFSPIADDSDDETGARIPSPPRERKAPGPRIDGGSDVAPPDSDAPANANRPILKNKRLNEMASPTRGSGSSPAALAKSPSTTPGGRAPPSSNPFASLGGSSPAPEQGGAGRGPEDDVGMRAARGKLGGAVRGGGGGGEAPSGWKPWAKGGARR